MGGCNGTKLLLEVQILKAKCYCRMCIHVCFFNSSKDTTQVSEFWQKIWNSEQFKSLVKHTKERDKIGEVKKGRREEERREEERENSTGQEQHFCDLFRFIAAVPYTADHLA